MKPPIARPTDPNDPREPNDTRAWRMRGTWAECREPRHKAYMVRYLPYANREPYANGHSAGSFEEYYTSRVEACTRLDELAALGAIEYGDVREIRACTPGKGTITGGTRYSVTLQEWRDE